jgi:mono/diheme cytochrome c family protein
MSESKSNPEVRPSREPKAGRFPTPLWAVTLIGVFTFVGIARLVDHGGAFDPNVYGSYSDFAKVEIAHPPPNIPESVRKGKLVYLTYCTACHGADGMGSAALNIPFVAGSDWVMAEGHNRLIRIVLNGLSGPITVSGKAFNGGNMNPWKDALKDEDIANVLSYVRNTWGNKGSLVEPEEVKKIRAATKDKDDAWSPAALLAIPLE